MPHYSPWRRLRWRYRYSPLIWLAAPLGAAPVVSIVTWLLPTWRGTPLTEAARWLWFAMNVFTALMMLFVLLFVSGRALPTPIPGFGPGGSLLLLMIIFQAGTAIALAMGRIDLAAACTYGYTALSNVHRCLTERRWRQLPNAIVNILIAVAVPLRSAECAISSLILAPLVKRLTAQSWADSVANKPTKDDYIRKMRKQFRGSPEGNSSDWLLKQFCDLELWDEAVKEYQRLQQHSRWTKNDPLVRARIAAGLGRYEEVYHLLTKIDAAKCDMLALFVAKVYAEQGQDETAREILAKVARCRFFDRFPLGEVYAALGDHERALECYEGVASYGRNYRILGGMASTLMALGEYRAASFLFTEGLRAAPYRVAAQLVSLAECFRRMGDERSAQTAERLMQSDL
jgi:tetratricopeptide (TPR) repeat protein